MTSGKDLFKEFSPVSARQWKEKILADLKGDDYAKLITPTLEGIDIQPFYHRETYSYLPFRFQPGPYRIVRAWEQQPSREQLEAAREHLVELVRFPVGEKMDYAVPEGLETRLELTEPDDNLANFLEKQGYHYGFNPYQHLLSRGEWHRSQETDMQWTLNRLAKDKLMTLEIDTAVFQNAGANITQQIAFALAQANEWLENGGSAVASRMRFGFAVGYHYFFEIAKFKAFRYLWKKLSGRTRTVIYARPSLRNKTLFDPYVNMLRTGMEVMAAVLGGADEIGNIPYNAVYRRNDENAQRLASNQLLILREEARFEQMRHAREGSYYVEQIAVELARNALDLWKKIENAGGFTPALLSGMLHEMVDEIALREQALFDEGKLVLTGTNKYILEDERPPEADKEIFSRPVKGKVIRPFVVRRLSEKIEKERLTKSASR